MDEYRNAITPSRDGTIIALEVTPGARETSFPAGYNAWRKSIGFHVREPPEGGRANAEIVRYLSKFFSVPPASIRILSGQSSSHKRILVRGVDPDVALALVSTRSNPR
ncbi:MAG: DUF167 domain-containing protein [Methanolinea sp.]|nr:DUF167 domain-containing protein [Methanolinea sp.]